MPERSEMPDLSRRTVKPQLLCFGDSVKLGARIELAEDRANVRAHRGVADVKLRGDGPVIGALDHECQDLSFSRSQAGKQLCPPGLLACDLAPLCESSGYRASRDQGLTRRGSADCLDNRRTA